MTGPTECIPPGVPSPSGGSPSARRFVSRVCLVTGAASGIGRATVMRFAAKDATVIAIDRDPAGAQETCALAELGTRGMALSVDVRNLESVSAMAAIVNNTSLMGQVSCQCH